MSLRGPKFKADFNEFKDIRFGEWKVSLDPRLAVTLARFTVFKGYLAVMVVMECYMIITMTVVLML